MQWFRSRVKLGSWVALFALALQLALTFGHVHLDGLRFHHFTPCRAMSCALVSCGRGLACSG